MIKKVSCANVSLVFFDKYLKGNVESQKFLILENLLKTLNDDINIDKILLVDNSPYNYLKKKILKFSKVVYIFVNKNIGFSKGHNLSRKYLSSQNYHLIINPDIVIEDKQLISNLINYLDKNSNISMIQPLIIGYPDYQIQYLCKRNPTLLIQIIRAFFNKFIQRYKFLRLYNDKYEMRDLAYKNKVVESSYLSGAFMLCRTKNLNKVSWFDERFFMYLEDADLTRRLSMFGRCVHYPLLKVRHVWARGSHKNKLLKIIAIFSFLKYSLKWGLKIF